MDYIAICDSFGFRGRYWKKDELVTNVHETEKIPAHFEAVKKPEREKKDTDAKRK